MEKEKNNSVYGVIANVRAEINAMVKKGKAPQFTFLSDEQLISELKPLFEKHGLLFIPVGEEITRIDNYITKTGKAQMLTSVRIDYNFVDVKTGDKIEGFIVGQGMDMGDKGVYKAITGAIKYLYIKTFNIPTQDDPENGGDIEVLPEGSEQISSDPLGDL